jgi:uncharacterized membrane protein YkvA (DUF1232 family)
MYVSMFALWQWWRRIGGWRGILADGLLAWRLMRDRRAPILPKLILPLFVLYFFSPVNLPLQWIPFIGQVDDAEHAARLQADLASGHFALLGQRAVSALDRWQRPR